MRILFISLMSLAYYSGCAAAAADCAQTARAFFEEHGRANDAYNVTVKEGGDAARAKNNERYCGVLYSRIDALQTQLDAANDFPKVCTEKLGTEFSQALDRTIQSLERQIEKWWKIREGRCG